MLEYVPKLLFFCSLFLPLIQIPDDNFSIPEGEEDLARAIQIVQEQTTDTQILVRILDTIVACSFPVIFFM